jgi:hypothetical protein
MIPKTIMTFYLVFSVDVWEEGYPGWFSKASVSLAPGRFGVAMPDLGRPSVRGRVLPTRVFLARSPVNWVDEPTGTGRVNRSWWSSEFPANEGMREICMQTRPQRVDIGLCGTSERSSSSAAYSQTLTGLAEGLSNNNATPLGDPSLVVLT